MKCVVIAFNLLIAFAGCAWGDGGRVRVNSGTGQVEGLLLQSDGGHNFWAFRGIPYAKPPVGQLRFQPPEAADSWENVLDATRDAPRCLQVDLMTNFLNPTIEGDEDCLYLNVYTPPVQQGDNLRAVMVYLHGGGFNFGGGDSTLYGPHRFMDKDIVLVTINYRLGVFGFLSTADSASPGNYGLMDQTLALRWVQQYIKNFGGDPERVTLFGQSAGAASTSLHMLLPTSKGLIHSTIQQSGNAISSWMLQLRPQKSAHALAQETNCSMKNTEEFVHCLKQKTAMQIIQAVSQIIAKNFKEEECIFLFGPVVDGNFLPDDPQILLANKKFVNPVPTLSGFTEDDGSFTYFWMLRAVGGIVEDDETSSIAKMMPLLTPTPDLEQLNKLESVLEILFDQLELTDKDDLQKRLAIISKIISSQTDIETDAMNEMMSAAGIDVYPYKFTFNGTNSILQITDGYSLYEEKYGADVISKVKLVTHGDELQYMFRCPLFPSFQLDDQETRMSDIVLTLWTNFAKNRTPTTDRSWEPTELDHPRYLNIKLEPTIVDDYLCNYYTLWKGSASSKNLKTEL